MKYSIHATKQDYQEAYDKLKILEERANINFDWKKIKRSSLDELDALIDILERRTNKV